MGIVNQGFNTGMDLWKTIDPSSFQQYGGAAQQGKDMAYKGLDVASGIKFDQQQLLI
jgi:hypothetical protein